MDKACPPDLSRYNDQSLLITDRHGQWLQAYLSQDDKYRLAPSQNTLPKTYQQLLINYEDRDFYYHHGIDYSAIVRAFWQNIQAGRVVSGASTLSMQTAKLLTPRPRTLGSKIIEAFRAWQLERRFSKAAILQIYATLIPAGGNREGLTTASYYYFNKPPDKLSLAESAWLVALPQSPKRLSSDHAAGLAARNKVLQRARDYAVIADSDYQRAIATPLRLSPTPLPQLIPHLGIYERAKKTLPHATHITTALDKALQQALHNTLTAQRPQLPDKSNLAAAIIDNDSGQWLAYAGSADFFNTQRQGQIDMLMAVRSPGSTLKPFISLLAFDRLHYQPQTTIDDTPIIGSAYQPGNYYFMEKLKQHGLPLYLPAKAKPNLSIALGGVGIRGVDLLRLYRQLANCAYQGNSQLAGQRACWQVTAILQHSRDEQGRVYWGKEPVAFKTGTSYGWRDNWLFAYTRDYTIVLWRGRADGQFSEQRASAETLIPLLRQVIALLPNPPRRYQATFAPELTTTSQLPPRLRHVGNIPATNTPTVQPPSSARNPNRLAIIAPLSDSVIDYSPALSLTFHIRGGKPPFIYLLNQQIIAQTQNRQVYYADSTAGSYQLLVIDSDGNTDEIHFRLQNSYPVNQIPKRAALQPTP